MNLTNPQLCQFFSSNIRLVPEIRLRAEYFGGLVYDTRNGNTLEVDKGAFQLLNSTKARTVKVDDLVKFLDIHKIVKYSDKSLPATLQKLFEFNIIERCGQTPSTPVLIGKRKAGTYPWLSAPETVHWAVTYRCSENCPDCYARRFSFVNTELDNSDALKLIDKVADWGVFQLAIGGGEPFARRDLPEIVNHAANQGLSVHITTGKLHLEQQILESVSDSIKSLQIGIRPNDLLDPDAKRSLKGIRNLVSAARNVDITPGANLILTKSTIQKLSSIVERLVNCGLNRIVLLRYKPPASIDRWKAENPGSDQMSQVHERIGRILRENPQLNMRVDCSLSFIQRYLPEPMARRVGIKGCVAADRILAIQNDIGYTPAGFPYAPYEQIAEWIIDPKYLAGYPAWIREYGSRNSGSLTSPTKEKNKKAGKEGQ